MTDLSALAGLTLRFDQFHPPCWQVWDGTGERLIDTFATKPLLNAALPSIQDALRARSQGGTDNG